MKFRRLRAAKGAAWRQAFALYEESFPLHERRPLGKQAALLGHPLYHFDVIGEGAGVAGILLYWEGSGYVYVEHFAIRPDMRGKALGSRVLEIFCQRQARVVLEIDPPAEEISLRREGFYLRMGFCTNPFPHVHPAYRAQYPPHALKVMSYPQQLTQAEYDLFRKELENVVMKDGPGFSGG